MREFLLALSVLTFTFLPACADTFNTSSTPASPEITTPTEVGNTSMPPGQYLVTDQVSHKSYSLTVTSRGTMILGPDTSTATTAGAVGAAVGAVGSAAVSTPVNAASTVKGLMEKGVQRGASELMKLQGKNAIQNLLK